MGREFIEVEGLKKTYQMGDVTVNAIREINFEIKEGEFVVILGPSGSGKSTLLNLLGGMDLPTEGNVFINDKEVTRFDDKQLTEFRRHDIGFVFQFYNLMANLTTKENIELATEITDDPLDVDEIIKVVGLEERSDHFPSQLSGGEQQRVAIARAVAKNPRLLLCDEPTGALDYATGVSILNLLIDVNKNYKKTVIVITHNSAIGDIADRVIKLRSGKITHNITNDNPIDPERIEW